MESYRDIISSLILAALLTSVIVPLIRYALYLKKWNERLENNERADQIRSDK
jgi:hypothetical protein